MAEHVHIVGSTEKNRGVRSTREWMTSDGESDGHTLLQALELHLVYAAPIVHPTAAVQLTDSFVRHSATRTSNEDAGV